MSDKVEMGKPRPSGSDGDTELPGNASVSFIARVALNAPGGAFACRAFGDEEILYANKTLWRLYGCSSYDEFIDFTGGTFRGMIYPEDYGSATEALWWRIGGSTKSVEGEAVEDTPPDASGTQRMRYRIVTKDQEIKYIDASCRYFDDPDYGPIIYSCILAAVEQDLAYEVDRVTGAPNMRYFLEDGDRKIRANRASEHPERLSVVYTNLTNFKLYNIRYGFEAGDRLLRDVNQGLIKLFPGHVIVRYSGDHFASVTKLTDYGYISSEIHGLVERLTPGSTVSCKFGIAVLDGVKSIATAVDLAKLACDSIRNDPNTLYRIYDDSLLKGAEEDRYTLANIDRALDEGWIQVYYQPVVRTIAPSLASFEALSRWVDPERGMRSPMSFIPALERAGIVWKLDVCVLDRICARMERRLAVGEPVLPVSFNLSRSDFFTCDIRALVNETVDRHGVPHRLLKVEVTESILVNDALRIQETLAGLRGDGYDIWIDDFGSGYSSLNVVKDFDFDEMKIDQRFLSKLDDKARSVISSTVSMAKKIGAQTLAEGVETEEAYDFLQSVGCEKVQGYLFGKPAPYEQSLAHCLDEGLTPETAELAHYYDAMGRVDFATAEPLAIVEDVGSTAPHFLYVNGPYREMLRSIGLGSRTDAERVIDEGAGPLQGAFRGFTDNLEKVGRELETEFVSGGRHIRLKGELLSTCCAEDGTKRRLFRINLFCLMKEDETRGDREVLHVLQDMGDDAR